ncbi:MAG: hypothetical protein A2284_18245 [Deltaproteobacteria bacterium RIFOXYA12_FULL_61_11]|nr:MAG: hypothetical protein A2284_18245 [Deltaproteobacteria bacterium RIFOXYA12_FULL_61_11]
MTYPPYPGRGTPMVSQNRQFQWFSKGSHIYPVLLGYAHALLNRAGHETLLLDAGLERLGWLAYLERVLDFSPELIAIEVKTPVVPRAWWVVDQLKAMLPGCTIALLGDHIAALPEESFAHCGVDVCVASGHYDLELLNVCAWLGGATPARGSWFLRHGDRIEAALRIPEGEERELDEVPFIDRRATKAVLYGEKWRRTDRFFYMMAGRDCTWSRCTFCSWTSLFRPYKVFSPQRYLAELRHLVEHHGALEVFDDAGTFPTGPWLEEFASRYRAAKFPRSLALSGNMRMAQVDENLVRTLASCGFRKLKIGLESANQATLDRLDKGLQIGRFEHGLRLLAAAGIAVHLTVMVGYPWEGPAEVERTYHFVRRLMKAGLIEFLQATIVVPYPGTRMHAEALERGWFAVDPNEYEAFDMTAPVLRTLFPSPKEVHQACRNLYTLHFHPLFLARTALHFKRRGGAAFLLRGLQAMRGHVRDFS